MDVKRSTSEPTIFSPDALSSVPISVPVQSKVILGYNKRLEKQIIAEKTAAKTKKKSEEKEEPGTKKKNPTAIDEVITHRVNVSIEPEIEHEYCVVEHKVEEKINSQNEEENDSNIEVISEVEEHHTVS